MSKTPIVVSFANSILYRSITPYDARLENVLLYFINTTFNFDPSHTGDAIIAQLIFLVLQMRLSFHMPPITHGVCP